MQYKYVAEENIEIYIELAYLSEVTKKKYPVGHLHAFHTRLNTCKIVDFVLDFLQEKYLYSTYVSKN